MTAETDLHHARHLEWDGCFNARDLGGLPTAGRGLTRRGAIVRADALDHLSVDGWAEVERHGISTVIDLRNAEERAGDTVPRPPHLTTLHRPIDGSQDQEFWRRWSTGWQFGTPLYYRPHLERMPERTAAVLAAIARSEPGGVIYHCGVGRDRTGLVTIVLLTLLGVPAEVIADDYELSVGRLPPLFERRGEDDHGPVVERFLADQGLTLRQTVLDALSGVDVEELMRAGGLTDDDLTALRARLVDSERA
jgi:hypothetical protein